MASNQKKVTFKNIVVSSGPIHIPEDGWIYDDGTGEPSTGLNTTENSAVINENIDPYDPTNETNEEFSPVENTCESNDDQINSPRTHPSFSRSPPHSLIDFQTNSRYNLARDTSITIPLSDSRPPLDVQYSHNPFHYPGGSFPTSPCSQCTPLLANKKIPSIFPPLLRPRNNLRIDLSDMREIRDIRRNQLDDLSAPSPSVAHRTLEDSLKMNEYNNTPFSYDGRLYTQIRDREAYGNPKTQYISIANVLTYVTLGCRLQEAHLQELETYLNEKMYPSHTRRMGYPESIITTKFNHNNCKLEAQRIIHYKLSDYRKLAFHIMEWVLLNNESKLVFKK